MSLFKILWLRRLIRRRTNKIPEERALLWKNRLSIIYMVLAGNAFAFVAYNSHKGKADWAKDYKTEEYLKLTPAQQWAQTLGIKKAKVYRISGFSITSYEIDNTKGEEVQQFKNINDLKK